MNIEYFRRKQMQLEKAFRKIGMPVVILSFAVGLIASGIGLLKSFVDDDINIVTTKRIPTYTNPIMLFFVALNMLVIVVLDKKGIIGKKEYE